MQSKCLTVSHELVLSLPFFLPSLLTLSLKEQGMQRTFAASGKTSSTHLSIKVAGVRKRFICWNSSAGSMKKGTGRPLLQSWGLVGRRDTYLSVNICLSLSSCVYFIILPLLQTGRTGFMCLQTYQRFASDSLKRCSWTTTEDTLLKELVEKMRIGNFIPYTQSKGITQAESWHRNQDIRVTISQAELWHHRQSQNATPRVTHSDDMQNTWIQHSDDITCMINW